MVGGEDNDQDSGAGVVLQGVIEAIDSGEGKIGRGSADGEGFGQAIVVGGGGEGEEDGQRGNSESEEAEKVEWRRA